MPPDWDLLVAGDHLVATLFELAMDPACPARRFALHCLYIYAADGIRTNFRAHPKRRLPQAGRAGRAGRRRADAQLGPQQPGAAGPAGPVRLPRLVRGRPGPGEPPHRLTATPAWPCPARTPAGGRSDPAAPTSRPARPDATGRACVRSGPHVRTGEPGLRRPRRLA